jgi:Ankyrin repeats (3 copies)
VVVAIIIVCAFVLATGVTAMVVYRRKVTARRVEALYQAAASGDRDRLQQSVDQGHSVDLQDNEGNTALHFAYCNGQQDAIDALVAYGADDNLRNSEGLSPLEMGLMAIIEAQLDEGVGYISGNGSWLDKEQGRIIYLKQHKPRIYNPALVRCVLTGRDRRKLLHLAIKLGIRDSEDRLAQVLHGYGTKDMAVDYLNAGSRVLREAAETWARRNNYRIVHMGGHAKVTWGQF